MGIFKIDVDEFEWIGGAKDDHQELCLHDGDCIKIILPSGQEEKG